MSTTLGGFIAGGIAAKSVVGVARLQLQGELSAKSQTKRVYTGVFQGVRVILKNEGPRGLMAGLGSAVNIPFPPHISPDSKLEN